MTAAIERNHAMIAREQTEPSGNAPELFSRGEAVNQHHGASAAAIFIMNFQAIGIEKLHCIHLLALRIYRGSTQGHNPPRLLSLLVVSFFSGSRPARRGMFCGAGESHPRLALSSHLCVALAELNNLRLAESTVPGALTRACAFFCHLLRR